MASRLMSAYGNLASARTDIGRSLSDIAGIGIEMEYGKEGRIAGQMEQSRIQRFTEAVGLGLETVQQIAGMGVSAEKEAARAKEMGTLSGKGAQQTVGETKLWDLFRGKADIGPGETFWGEVGERIGTGLGFMDREYDIGGSAYTSSQIEAGLPYAKLGKDWEDVSKLMGGGTKIGGVGSAGTGNIPASQPGLGRAASGAARSVSNIQSPATQPSKYADMTFGEYLDDPSMDQSLVNRLMAGGWDSAWREWKTIRGSL